MSPTASVMLLLLLLLCTAGGARASPVAGSLPLAEVGSSSSPSKHQQEKEEEIQQRPVCLRLTHSGAVIVKEEGDHVLPGGQFVQCATHTDYCFSYWTYDKILSGSNTTKQLKWLAQGCFSSSDACKQDECVASRQNPANTFFCCCRGHLCNRDVSVPPQMETYTDAVVSAVLGSSKSEVVNESSTYSYKELAPHWVVVLITAFLVTSAATLYAAFAIHRRRRKASLSSLSTTQELTSNYGCDRHYISKGEDYSTGCAVEKVDIGKVILKEIIGRGRFGAVHRALAGEREVVVKVFDDSEKESYVNELFIYSHPFMHHQNLLELLGSGNMGPSRFGLVLPLISGGRLCKHLSERTLTFEQLCRVCYTATRGLAHLHAPIVRSNVEKPSISHRDFNSRNLLLRDDMSCVVIDLGLAVCVKGSSHSRPGVPPASGIPPALNEAGSVRYMAPELLEGAVNLSECESALRQIDVYALGLVLWECYTRCHEIVDKEQVYQVPYEAELGKHLSIDGMIQCVVRDKSRPKFPQPPSEVAKSPAIRLLRDTIEECWDPDAEARLSAQCVMERLAQLQKLWHKNTDTKTAVEDIHFNKNVGNEIEYGYDNSTQQTIYITENGNAHMPPPMSYEEQEPPAYSEYYDAPAVFQPSSNVSNSYLSSEHYSQSVNSVPKHSISGSSMYEDRWQVRCSSSCGEKPGVGDSTHTLETMLSPSASGQPALMLKTGRISQSSSSLSRFLQQNRGCSVDRTHSHSENGPFYSAVLQRGSTAPVSVLHTPSSPIWGNTDTYPIISSPIHGEAFANKGSAVSRIWAKIRRKVSRSNSCRESNKFASNVHSSRPHDYLTENGLLEVDPKKDQSAPLLTYTINRLRSTEQSHYACSNDEAASYNLLRSFISERQQETIFPNNGPTETDFRYSNINSRADLENQNNSTRSELAVQKENHFYNTIPKRRHTSVTNPETRQKKLLNRPVSLEIKTSPEEVHTSPLGVYLSNSLNFKTPEEVVLRKTRTRVKTPRHPPLSRLALNSTQVHDR